MAKINFFLWARARELAPSDQLKRNYSEKRFIRLTRQAARRAEGLKTQ